MMPPTSSPIHRDSRGATVEFVNHASFILELGGTRLISDPWLFGTAFNDGWNLLCDYSFDMERFREIDYIWISHEHPDHFSPPVLRSIPQEIRKDIVVLCQKTADRKILNYCSRLGFTVQDLHDGQSVRLKNGIVITCGQVPLMDSWLLCEFAGIRVLNVNDCVIGNDARAADLKKTVGNVDVLFTQFSYAGWHGNAADRRLRVEAAALKLEAMKKQIAQFEPVWTVPFASFAYFSHEENRHSNDSINEPLDAVHSIIDAGSQAVLMYPGDTWRVGDVWENEPAANKYKENYDLSQKKYSTSEPVCETDLVESSRQYSQRMRQNNNALFLRIARGIPVIGLFHPIKILIYDLESTYTMSLWKGLTKQKNIDPYDVKMHSSCLDYAFRFDWGYDTLAINGRFEADMAGFNKLTKMFAVGPFNNTGRFIRLRLLFDPTIIRVCVRTLRKLVLRNRMWGA